MSIRVGRIDKGYPSFEGYEPIIIMTKSSKYGAIGPYCLKNDQGQIMENIYQFHKIYKNVPKSVQRYSKWDNRVIWNWPAETHINNETNEPNEKYWKWREAGLNAPDPIRYPVGFNHRHECLYALWNDKKLNYIESRKEIYIPVYSE